MRLQGVIDSPDDPDLLLAEIAGQPVLHKDRITVEPRLRYDSIDIATGSVDFTGSVVVRGDIRSGMKVNAGGDITDQGVIESAEVSAGGDIRVPGGIIGHAFAQHSPQQPIGRSKIIKLLKDYPEKREIYEEARLRPKKLSADIVEELEDERVIEAEGKFAEHAKVVVGEAVAAGVTIVMGRRSVLVNKDSGRGVFHLEGWGEIRFSTLARGNRMR